MTTDRRGFLVRGGALLGAGATLAACAQRADEAAPASTTRHGKLVTAWPAGFAGLGAAATRLAEAITRASGGRITVQVYGGGELVGPFEVFDAVGDGRAELGHSASHFWAGRLPAAPFFCALPFGLNA